MDHKEGCPSGDFGPCDCPKPMTFEDWKLAYRHRVALIAGVKHECFAETLNMIADDQCLMEEYQTGISANDAADNEMSCWEE